MKPIIKSMHCDDFDLETHIPDRSDCFSFELLISIGTEEQAGADYFRVFVCTPTWISENVWLPRWGRHMLIVQRFDLEAIRSTISMYLAECKGKDWNAIATQIAKVLAWEFEDYQE